jgi:uncharacterized protein GlcG (DUF336 family)
LGHEWATNGQISRTTRRFPTKSRGGGLTILIDDGGTPTDPSDDVFLGGLGVVKGSTGRNDDLCAAAVEALS